jgi:hypothetical protein
VVDVFIWNAFTPIRVMRKYNNNMVVYEKVPLVLEIPHLSTNSTFLKVGYMLQDMFIPRNISCDIWQIPMEIKTWLVFKKFTMPNPSLPS